MLKPIDIREKEFEIKMRGYDREQVDDFLDIIMQDMATLYKDNASLTEEINNLKAKMVEIEAKEKSLEQSVELTKYQCEEMRKSAKLEAKEIIDKANATASDILHSIEDNKIKITEFCKELLEKVSQI